MPVLAILIAVGVSAEVRFGGLDLGRDNRLLFRATVDSPVYGSYDTLFHADLATLDSRQLTVYPERATLLSRGLQVTNRFGLFRTDPEFTALTPIEQFPGFVHGNQIRTGKLPPMIASPDGAFLVYVEQTSSVRANLKLYDLEADEEVTVTRGIALTLDDPPVAWSPNGEFFVYQKANTLYYYSIDQLKQDRVIAEGFRELGDGRISSVRWGTENEVYLISGTRVYQIFSAEFFTRSLYPGLLRIGRIIGKIPFPFDPNFDQFWISPGGDKILLDKGGRNIFLYYIQPDDFLSTGDTKSLPYLFLPRNTQVLSVLWPTDDSLTILAGSIERGETRTSVFQVNLDQEEGPLVFRQTEDEGVTKLELSPNGEKVAVLKSDRVVIRDYATWQDEQLRLHPEPIHALWASDRGLLVLGARKSEYYDLSTGDARLLGLSQPGDYGYAEEGGRISVEVAGTWYDYDRESGTWSRAAGETVAPARVASERFRVYVEENVDSSYRNLVMVRKVDGYGTLPLFAPSAREYEPFPREDEPVDFELFAHGSRIRRREVALVFNAIDSAEGLTSILRTLKEYDLRCTFIVSGEFIRSHPGAVKEIADSGHEVGSLFYVYFNMTDARYQVDRDFVIGGLARNEDDYFAATGKELSLVWHAPYYFVSSSIIDAAQEMNYQYVGRDVDSLDWVTEDADEAAAGLYLPAAELVERIIQLKAPGSIIPIRVGKPGEREDYLFQKLDVLINGLVALGYEVVTATTLIEHAR